MANRVDAFLEMVVKQGGSDLHLVSSNPPRMRIFGEAMPIKYRVLSVDETAGLLYEIMPGDLVNEFEMNHALDFGYEVEGLARFRVNVFRHWGGMGGVFRVVPYEVPLLEELQLPAVLKSFCQARSGLVLVTGPSGSGKSTTLAAMINEINEKRSGHIIAIEDPVEFLHTRNKCLISQREVGVHTESFSHALRSALREDPDVILVGELRDYETISLAVTAAETGILVYSTLHTNGAAATVDRMINVFPAEEQPRIRTMLSTSLVGVVSQQLVRREDGRGRVAAMEVLVNNSASANIIREGKADQLHNVIQGGALQGMQTMDNALRKLVDAKVITGEEAHRKAFGRQEFAQYSAEDDWEE
jgi:twitching motility protein PilT